MTAAPEPRLQAPGLRGHGSAGAQMPSATPLPFLRLGISRQEADSGVIPPSLLLEVLQIGSESAKAAELGNDKVTSLVTSITPPWSV